VEELRSLRTAEVRGQQERLVRQYAAAVRSQVLSEAKYGTATHAHFWLVKADIARVHLKYVTGQFYHWHSKYIHKTGYAYPDAMLRRPIPYELVKPIGDMLGSYFPDAVIEIVESNLVVGCELQKFLMVRWN